MQSGYLSRKIYIASLLYFILGAHGSIPNPANPANPAKPGEGNVHAPKKRVSATARSSPTSSSSIIFTVETLFPKPSSSLELSLPGLLPTTQSSMVLSTARFFVKPSLSSVSTAAALPPTFPFLTVSATARSSPTSSSSIILTIETLFPKPSSSPVLSLSGLLPTTQSSMVLSTALFLLKPSLSSVSTAAALPPTFPFLTVSATARSSPTSSSSIIITVGKLFPSSSPVLSLPGILPTTQSSMVLSTARLLLKPSLSSVSTAATLLPTSPYSTVSATARSSSTSSSSIIFPIEILSTKPSSLIVPSLTLFSIRSPPSNISVERSSTPPSSVLKSVPLPSPTLTFSLAPLSTSSSKSQLKEIQKLANDSVSKLSGLIVTSNNSLLEAANVFGNFTVKYLNITHGKDQPGVDEFRTESIFRVAVAFEKFALSYGKYHLSGTRRSVRIDLRNMFLAIQNGYRQNASDFYLEEQEWQASINISSRNFRDNGSVIVGCVYKDLHDLLQAKSDKICHVQTRIIMAAMDPKPVKLQENVTLTFKNLKNDPREKHCTFWSGLSESQDGFSKDGCHVVTSLSNTEETVCSCNHLTHFAVLVDYSGASVLSQKYEDTLEIITYIGLSLSIIGMIPTIIMYSLFTDVHEPLTQIRLSLVASIAAGQISFLAGMHALDNPAICITVAVLTQYFVMAAFCWMLVEGIYFYLLIVKVYNISNRLIVYHVMAWGFPIIMVSTSLSIAIGKGGIQSYTSDKYCWLPSTYDLIWIFVTFLTATGVLNSFILARITRKLTTLPQTRANKILRVRVS
ncbi:adhesion G protein-coupled receptor L4-like isoform X2 [Pocillopora verrucosa]|uniref:adhesion G protein-coupled receptor L4-like isoform X2 n=1 Tax=Pocillopora verrucosa TaxID=203993 RepID=UPI0033424B1D